MPDTPEPDKPDELNVSDITESELDSISGGFMIDHGPIEQVLPPGTSAPPPKPPPPPPPLLFW